MILNKSYSFWSALFGILGLILLLLSYIVTPDNPEGFMYYLILIIFVAGLVSLLLGFISSIIALRNKEKGNLKLLGLLIPLLIFLVVTLIPFVMGLLFAVDETS